MNVLQGSFYSTAFRVREERAFETDPVVMQMLKHLEMFTGQRDGRTLHCICSKGSQPKTNLEVRAPAILGLLEDTSSGIPIEDSRGWIEALQRHLHDDFGIVIDETAEGEQFMTYLGKDRAGWTRRHAVERADRLTGYLRSKAVP